MKTAFDAINAGTHKGTIEVLIHGSTTETATAKLNDGVTLPASYTGITIYPTTTGLSISGSLAAPLIDLDGADNVTFDGRENGSGTPKALTIINTNPGSAASTSTIRFINDATSNVVQHCIIKGASTDPSGGVVFFSTTPLNINGTGNSQNLIQLNDITGVGTSRPVNTVYSYGFEARINIYDIIRNNNFYNFLNPAKSSGAITLADNNALWEITGNSFYETDTLVPSKDVEYHMIRIENSGAFYTVTGNYIGGSANSCGGSPLTKTNGGDNIFYGIYFNVNSDVNSGIISGNRIKNISWSNSGNATWTAINVVDGAVTVGGPNPSDGNMIGDTIGTGSIIVTNDTLSGNVIGIKTTSDKSISIQNNLIGSVTADNSIPDFSTSLWGILNEGINGVVSIADNRIGSDTTAQSIHAKSPSTAAQQTVYGIYNFTPCYLTVSGNRISHLLNASINDNGLINGIYVEEGSNKILNNSISNITIKGGIQVQWLSSVIGINLYNFFPDTNIVSGNTIYNLSNEGSGDIVSNVIGLYINAGSNPDINRIEKNFIHSLTNLSTNSG
ncbi:MAG: hypothetical protein NTW16_05635, partial [Bacteroidetes bacterium]|nr:hypothetical protein [Bacteroidota bacterium]